MNNKVEKCNFYNDHDCSVPECDEILDERYLPVYLCEERKNCAFRKYNKCEFHQNGYCGECNIKEGEEYYFEELAKCSDNPNCNYKQLLAEQSKNKKLVKEKEELHAFLHNKFNWSKDDVWIRNYLASYIFNERMGEQALNEVNNG